MCEKYSYYRLAVLIISRSRIANSSFLIQLRIFPNQICRILKPDLMVTGCRLIFVLNLHAISFRCFLENPRITNNDRIFSLDVLILHKTSVNFRSLGFEFIFSLDLLLKYRMGAEWIKLHVWRCFFYTVLKLCKSTMSGV